MSTIPSTIERCLKKPIPMKCEQKEDARLLRHQIEREEGKCTYRHTQESGTRNAASNARLISIPFE